LKKLSSYYFLTEKLPIESLLYPLECVSFILFCIFDLRPGVRNVSCSLVGEYLYFRLISMWTMGYGKTVLVLLENSNRNISYGLDEWILIPSKGKTIPLQAWTGPGSSRRLRLADFKTFGT